MANPTEFLTVDSLKYLRSEIHKRVNKIRITENHDDIVEDLNNLCLKPTLTSYYPIISPLSEHHGAGIHRARQCNRDTPFTNIKDFLNPPTPSGRAYNDENTPILYASSSIQTCLAECNPKIGQCYTIAHFNYSAIASENYWFVGQLQTFQRSSEPSIYLADRKPVELPSFYPNAGLHSWTFTDSLINEIFSELSTEHDNYLLNRYVINEVINTVAPDKNIFGVVFNSVKSKPGTNFAFYGKSIDMLELGIVNLIEITDIDDYGYIAYNLLKNSNPKGKSYLEWPEHEYTNV